MRHSADYRNIQPAFMVRDQQIPALLIQRLGAGYLPVYLVKQVYQRGINCCPATIAAFAGITGQPVHRFKRQQQLNNPQRRDHQAPERQI